MATMTIRTSVAFDPVSVSRWERLAAKWGVSKSEALRRALEAAENQSGTSPTDEPRFEVMPPLEILAWLREHPQPPVPGGWGENSQVELRDLRDRDAEIEEERDRSRGASSGPPSSP